MEATCEKYNYRGQRKGAGFLTKEMEIAHVRDGETQEDLLGFTFHVGDKEYLFAVPLDVAEKIAATLPSLLPKIRHGITEEH
ncbi:MAG: hypothetical protein GC185_01755 [Alphaproteobacteria bacterium]|nr:hypothetical protein [Alphaproteobacteria bacterium]